MSKHGQRLQQILASNVQSTPSAFDANLGDSGLDGMAKQGLEEMVDAAAARAAAADLDAVADKQKAAEPSLKAPEPPATPSKAQLEKAAAAFREKFSPQGIKRLVDGGIEVKFVVDVDMANCLLDWAEGAGQAPAEFIQRHLTEALAAYTGV